MDSNTYQVIKDSITGRRAVDEQTFSAIATLSERLKQLQKSESIFNGVSFSPAVEQLANQKHLVAIG